MPTINRLIKKIASNPSTEELIVFIADNDEMVKECVGLQKRLETSNSRELDDLDGLCRNHHISLDMFSREVHNIVAIFAPDSVSDEYAVLGLKAGADQKQVKKAFRKLSIKYHPDSSGSGDSNKFIKICQAYKTIISRSGSDKPTHGRKTTSWRYTKKRGLTAQQKRRNIYLFSTLAVLLVIISIIAPYMYRKKVMLKNLNSADPVLVNRQEMSIAEPAEQKVLPDKLTVESDTRTEEPVLQDEVVEINTPEPDTARLSSAPPVSLESTPPPPEHPTVSSKPEPTKQPDVFSPPEPVNSADPVLVNRQEMSIAEPAEQKVLPDKLTVESDTRTEEPVLQDEVVEINTPEPDTASLSSAPPVSLESTPPPPEHPTVSSKPEPTKQPDVFSPPEPETPTLLPVSKKLKPPAVITNAETLKKPDTIRIHETAIQATESTSSTDGPSGNVSKVVNLLQSPATDSRRLNTQSINDFIQAYTRAYANKDLQQFSRFFTRKALENGHSFTEQHDEYVMLFKSVDTIDLDIDILSSNMKDQNIQLRGRFQINLTYPQQKPVQQRGQIFFLLTDSDQQYLVKEMSYTFDKAE